MNGVVYCFCPGWKLVYLLHNLVWGQPCPGGARTWFAIGRFEHERGTHRSEYVFSLLPPSVRVDKRVTGFVARTGFEFFSPLCFLHM